MKNQIKHFYQNASVACIGSCIGDREWLRTVGQQAITTSTNVDKQHRCVIEWMVTHSDKRFVLLVDVTTKDRVSRNNQVTNHNLHQLSDEDDMPCFIVWSSWVISPSDQWPTEQVPWERPALRGAMPFRQPGSSFSIKMPYHWYRKSHRGDKTILQSSYLRNGSYTGKTTSGTTSLYWIWALYAVCLGLAVAAGLSQSPW